MSRTVTVTTDAWVEADPIPCEVCGLEACEDHLPAHDSLPPFTPEAVGVNDAEAQYEQTVSREKMKLRARRDAQRQLNAEERGLAQIPPPETLRERLARPPEVVSWRIDGMLPIDGRVVLAAQYKAGKTTMIGNLLRSLVDGDAFLGRFAVYPVDGVVALLDFEMSPSRLDAWLRDQRIAHDDRIVVLPMRGQASSFDITDPAVRGAWAALLRDVGVRFVILDCLRPILDAIGRDENKEAGVFLVHLDALCKEAGIAEAAVVHHMGHGAERARGDSRIRDWPDVEWRLVRQDDNPNSARFFSAFGRDVDLPESQLAFDEQARRLSIMGGGDGTIRSISRKDRKHLEVLPAIVEVLDEFRQEGTPKPSGAKIVETLEKAGSDFKRDAIRAALKFGRSAGYLDVENGPKRAQFYARGRKSWELDGPA